MVAILIPNFIELISNLLGFEQTSNMIFCLTIFIAFGLIFSLTMILTKQANRTILLIKIILNLSK